MFIKHIQKSYYQYKIIATFSIVTVLLVAVLAKVSYNFMYDFYLNQLTENVKQTTHLTVGQIQPDYLTVLNSGIITSSTKNYLKDLLGRKEFENIYSELFLFDKKFNVIVHSNLQKPLNLPEPRLYLNETEIFNMANNSIITSLPFKGNDANWYLWGFYRFSDEYWLAVRASAANFESVDNLAKTIWMFGLIGIAFSILLGFLVAKSVTKPISSLVKFSVGIGKGNLNETPPTQIKGELKILSDALVLMRKNITDNHKEKEKILAQIAHEIRNPLGGIELLTNLMHESLEGDTKNKEYSEKILKEITGLKELITSYLSFSRSTPAVQEKVNIKEIVEESISYVKKDLDKYKIRVECNLESQLVIFDKIHFRNIILNLLKNSIDSIKENGEIIIQSISKQNKDLIIISDNGCGIPKENIGKIFDPFFTTKNNGTGLGLATCKKFCEENSAQLIAKNLKQGCSFTIIKDKTNE